MDSCLVCTRLVSGVCSGSEGFTSALLPAGDPELPAAKLTEMCSEAMKVVSKCEQLILEL